MAEEHRVDYHAGLIAALKAKYDDNYEFMETIKELTLGEKAPRTDAVVLKKDPSQLLTDEVGSFFNEHNVIEFKGFGDGINSNDFYKAQGYAIMYMTIDRKVDEIPIEKVTVTVLQYRNPRETFKKLKAKGCSISIRSKGVWEVTGPMTLFLYQVVDLDVVGKGWEAFKIIIPGAKMEDIEAVQEAYEKAPDGPEKDHLGDVLRTSIESNKDTFRLLKEEGKMSEAVGVVFAEEIAKQAEAREEKIVANMIRSKQPLTYIAQMSEWPMEKLVKFAESIGYTAVAQ
ncbi:MAG: hypothetical protein IJ188_07715 [Clostridia bacterium]|nr:hypothetical protein [Clostridia bacterium]